MKWKIKNLPNILHLKNKITDFAHVTSFLSNNNKTCKSQNVFQQKEFKKLCTEKFLIIYRPKRFFSFAELNLTFKKLFVSFAYENKSKDDVRCRPWLEGE